MDIPSEAGKPLDEDTPFKECSDKRGTNITV